MGAYVVRRLIQGAITLFVLAFPIYGLERALRPENYPGEAYLPHLWHDVERALLHLDFGRACLWPGCPHIHDLWMRGLAGDLWLLAGGIAVGVSGGVGVGLWCARHSRALGARLVEQGAMVAYCAPVWVVGLGLVLLFNRDVGRWPVPYFFDVRPRAFVSPLESPWSFLRSYVVPWLVLGAPLAAACLRATVALTLDELDADYVRTAYAKGLSRRRVMRHHVSPVALASVSQLVWASIPVFVTNAMLVEWVFDVPGFFVNLRRAIDKDPAFPGLDIPMIQAITLWAAALIVALGIVADLVLARIDPRARSALVARGSGRTGL
jgi:peptide/nickel transport system permease protein